MKTTFKIASLIVMVTCLVSPIKAQDALSDELTFTSSLFERGFNPKQVLTDYNPVNTLKVGAEEPQLFGRSNRRN
ncbi:MAG TPA: hypothetical protein VIN11_01500, partial [Roseivirga sp.]